MEYEINYTGSNLPTTSCFIGNGKLGVVPSVGNTIDVERVVISKNVAYKNGQYQTNVIDTFVPFGVEMFSLEDMFQTTTTNTSQSLNMNTGICSRDYTVRRGDATESNNGSTGPPASAYVLEGYGSLVATTDTQFDVSMPPFTLDLNSSMYCVRHLPYSTMQTLDCTNVNKTDIRFLHECWTQDNIVDVVYENSVKFTGGDTPVYAFIGHGRTHDGIRVAFASAYLFENPGAMVVKPMGIGTNLQSTKRNFQFNCFDLMNIVGAGFKLHIISTFVTSHDFEDPRSEVIRIAGSICSPHPLASTPTSIAQYIRGKHVDAWGKLWATKVRIAPKLDASAEQMSEVRELNTCLYSALYHIYCSVRENFNMESNPGAIPILDIDGSMMYEADIWLVPVLLILKPDMARAIIEYRYASLQLAMQLAASYGMEGAKIPYIDDIIGFKNNLYYNTGAYVHLFNTCMVAINTWNYYRVSRDKDWLRDKGYAILKAIAAYLAGVVKIDDEDGTVILENVVGLNSRVSISNNTFSNNLVKLAMKFAIEASYEMNYSMPDSWTEIFNGLELPLYSASRIYKVDDQSIMDDKYSVLEVLQSFVPGFWENMNRNNYLLFAEIMRNNYDFYMPDKLHTGDDTRPINIGLRGICEGLIMNSDSSMLPKYMASIQQYLNDVVSGPWRNMKVDVKILNRRPTGLPFASANSLTSNAIFLMMIIQGIIQMRIVGGISNTRFYYEDLSISYATAATMPHYWAHVSVTNYGMGNNKGTVDVRHNVYDLQYNPPNVGGSFIMPGNFGVYTP